MKIQRFFKSLLFLLDGTTLIGCSELTGRYWNGGVNIIQCEGKDKKFDKTEKKNISLTSGTADGCFVENSNKVMFVCCLNCG